MYPIRRSPGANPFASLERTMDRMLGGALSDAPATYADFAPALDVTEADDAYVVRVEVPGVAPEDLQVTVEQSTLTLSGEKKPHAGAESDRRHLLERRFGRFVRTIEFPHAIDADHVEATFRNGVVTLRLPKPEKVKARTVAIRTEE